MEFFRSPLPIIPGKITLNGKILVQAGPVQAEGRYLDLRKQTVGLPFEAGIALNGEAEVQTASHRNVNAAVAMERLLRDVSQCAHRKNLKPFLMKMVGMACRAAT
jgi:hypothetical protein